MDGAGESSQVRIVPRAVLTPVTLRGTQVRDDRWASDGVADTNVKSDVKQTPKSAMFVAENVQNRTAGRTCRAGNVSRPDKLLEDDASREFSGGNRSREDMARLSRPRSARQVAYDWGAATRSSCGT